MHHTTKGKTMNAFAMLVLATLTAAPGTDKFVSLDGKTMTTVKIKAKSVDPLAVNLILMLEAIESGDKDIMEKVFCGESKAALSCAEDKVPFLKTKLGKTSLITANQIVQVYGKSRTSCWDGTQADKQKARQFWKTLSRSLKSLGNSDCSQNRIKWIDMKDATKL